MSVRGNQKCCIRTIHVSPSWVVRIFFFFLLIPSFLSAALVSKGGIATDDSHLGTATPDYAFDGDTTSSDGGAGTAGNWFSGTSLTDHWLKYELLSSIVVSSYVVVGTGNMDYVTYYCPGAWVIEGSNTGSFAGEQTQLDYQSGIVFSSGHEGKWFTIADAVAFRFYRMLIIGNGGNYSPPQNGVTIKELELWGGGEAPPEEVVDSTDTRPVRLVSISSDVVNALTPGIFKNFTGADLSFWFGIILGLATIWGFKAGGLC